MDQSEIAIACQLCEQMKQQNLILIHRLKDTNAILVDYTKKIEKLKIDNANLKSMVVDTIQPMKSLEYQFDDV